jgi:hypothetical protein
VQSKAAARLRLSIFYSEEDVGIVVTVDGRMRTVLGASGK